jgi:serine/threonine protein kinase
MNRHTFLQHLRRSRLLSEQELADAVARLPNGEQAKALARALIRQGVLTRFQARRLLAGKAGRLVLGQYRLLDQIGRGGMGRVFKAMHTTMGRVVALKVVSPALLKDDHVITLFHREVRAAAQLHHPHIATAYDANEARGMHYLVMEYIEGPSLHKLVNDQGPLPIDLACELMRQAARALQYASEQGVVHRDIKPANLLIAGLAGPSAAEGQAGTLEPMTTAPPVLKVVDFGLARIRGPLAGTSETIMARTGAVIGTLDYIAPEQGNNIHDADIRSDLYSLGCTFYYVLTGQVPFPNCAPLEKLLRHLMHQPPLVQSLRPEVPAAVAAIVARLMAKDPEQRFQTPAELVQELPPWWGPGFQQEVPAATAGYPPDGPAGGQQGGMEGAAADPVAVVPSTVAMHPARPIDAAFREKWHHWLAIVEVSVKRRGARHWINPRAYQALQAGLVNMCRAEASSGERKRRDFFQRLQGLISPWVTAETLTQTELEIHFSLLELCRQMELEINTWAGVAPTKLRSSESTLGSILGRFRKHREPSDIKETMRNLYGVEL